MLLISYFFKNLFCLTLLIVSKYFFHVVSLLYAITANIVITDFIIIVYGLVVICRAVTIKCL